MYDVAVLGLGAMGAMTAWRCASRGASVVGIEQFTPAHRLGSSHGGSRIFRETIFEGVDYLPIVARAKGLWRRLEKDSGATVFRPAGALYIGPRDGELIGDALAAGAAGGFEQELLEPEELAERYPQHATIDGDVAVFEAGAGLLDPEASILAAIGLAENAGARLHFETTVTGLGSDDDGVRIDTSTGTLRAKRAVVATGAWFDDLIPGLGLPVRVQRSSALFFAPADPDGYGYRRFPAFIRKSGDVDGWGVPDVDGTGVKLGAGPTANKPWLDRPEDNGHPLDHRDTAPAEEFCRRAFPALTPKVVAGWPCMNAKTPDLDFVVGTTERAPHLVLTGGFSGHGFKHASGIGDIAADLALDGACDIRLDRFSPDRFGL
ncbi:N-methyl-L-tryptophan oxidase [Mycobacterium sp. NPDC003449]